jgi:hypothetical protein
MKNPLMPTADEIGSGGSADARIDVRISRADLQAGQEK